MDWSSPESDLHHRQKSNASSFVHTPTQNTMANNFVGEERESETLRRREKAHCHVFAF